MFVAFLRRAARWAAYSLHLLFSTSIIFFLTLEAFPRFIQYTPLLAYNVTYYAIKSAYLPDDKLVFRSRGQMKDIFTRGPHWGEVHAEYADIVKPYRYQATFNEFGFRANSTRPPYRILFIGDSFVEMGETDRNTVTEELAVRTGLSVYNAGSGGYGPYQYLELFNRFVPLLKPRTVVISVFAGNDINDVEQYENWMKGGSYYWFGDQASNIAWRYYAAMRDVYLVVRSRSSAWLQETIPIRQKRTENPGMKYSNLGLFKFGTNTVPMVFRYWSGGRSTQDLLETRGWKSMETILSTIKRQSDQSHIKLIVLAIPTKLQVYGRFASNLSRDEFKFRLADELRSEDSFSQAFGVTARRLDLNYVDLLPVFRQLGRNCIFYHPFDVHWNVYGRRVAAALVAQRIAMNGEPLQPLDLESFGSSRDLCTDDPNK